MAKRGTSQGTLKSADLSSPDRVTRAIAILSTTLDEVRRFDPNAIQKQFSPEVSALKVAVTSALERAFGPDTVEAERYRSAARFNDGPYNYAYDVPPSRFQQTLREERELSISLLQRAITDLEQEIALSGPPAGTENSSPKKGVPSNRVFVVHGHDDGAKEAIARLLMQIELTPIVLHEQPNQGRTIIEKFEHFSDVGFAVIALTPDDVGGRDAEHLSPRPRQNVLMELGFFLGKLGRQRVCALKKGSLDLPSDYDGVLWTDLDGGGAWRHALARELQAAGYSIDWNKIMKF